MTISSSTASASYTGNGTTTAFTIPFYFLVDTDVKISKKAGATGAITVLTLNSDYTLTGSGNQAGGTATLTVAPLGGTTPDQLFIERNVAAVQQTAYPSNSPFPAASHEKALDRLTMLVQQILTALGLKLGRNALSASYDAGGNRIANGADAVSATDLTTQQQVDQKIAAAATGVAPADVALYSRLASTAAGAGAALVAFLQNGSGAVPRTLLARGQDTLHAADFGVSASNSDNQAALQAVLAAAATLLGADILLPPGVLSHSGPLVVNSRNVRLIGAGGNSTHSGGTTVNPGTCLFYTGATTGVDHLTFTSVSGASNQKQHGGGLRGVWLDGNLKAARGLVVSTFNGGHFEDVFSQNHTAAQFAVCIFGGTLVDALDSQGNVFINCTANEYLSSGDGWVLDGGSGGNASFNMFFGCGALHNNGVGWRLKNCDNNLFHQTRAFKNGSGGGYAMELQGSTATYSCARANRFYQLSVNSSIVARGTTSYAVASYGNSIFMLDKENSTPDPTIETGAQLSWESNLAISLGSAEIKLAVADNAANAGNARSAIGNESLHVRNSSSAHAIFDDGTNSWAFNIDNNGNWRWQGPAGKYLVPFNDVYFAASANANFTATGTTATAGTGGSLPAQVTGYIVVKVNGTAVKVPYYNT